MGRHEIKGYSQVDKPSRHWLEVVLEDERKGLGGGAAKAVIAFGAWRNTRHRRFLSNTSELLSDGGMLSALARTGNRPQSDFVVGVCPTSELQCFSRNVIMQNAVRIR